MERYEFWTAIVALVALFAGTLYLGYDISQYLNGCLRLHIFCLDILIVILTEFLCMEICGYYLCIKDSNIKME